MRYDNTGEQIWHEIWEWKVKYEMMGSEYTEVNIQDSWKKETAWVQQQEQVIKIFYQQSESNTTLLQQTWPTSTPDSWTCCNFQTW